MLKLGEILLAANAITEAELDAALEHHVLHGVKLGTYLVETGIVTDEILVECLGRQTGQPFLTKEQLISAGTKYQSYISSSLIKKHRIIPVGTHGSALRLATDSYLTTKKQSELENIIGRAIEPVVISGYALDCFLEEQCGIQRPGRFLPKLTRQSRPMEPSGRKTFAEETALVAKNGIALRPLGEQTLDEGSFTRYEEALSGEDETFVGTVKLEASRISSSDAAEQLCRVRSRDDVAKTLLDYAANYSDCYALLIIKDDQVRGWKAVSREGRIPDFESFAASLDTLPDIRQCVERKAPYPGSSASSESGALLHTLKFADVKAAYFPIVIRERVAAVLVCEVSEKLKAGELSTMCRKASYALEILILKSKIIG